MLDTGASATSPRLGLILPLSLPYGGFIFRQNFPSWLMFLPWDFSQPTWGICGDPFITWRQVFWGDKTSHPQQMDRSPRSGRSGSCAHPQINHYVRGFNLLVNLVQSWLTLDLKVRTSHSDYMEVWWEGVSFKEIHGEFRDIK